MVRIRRRRAHLALGVVLGGVLLGCTPPAPAPAAPTPTPAPSATSPAPTATVASLEATASVASLARTPATAAAQSASGTTGPGPTPTASGSQAMPTMPPTVVGQPGRAPLPMWEAMAPPPGGDLADTRWLRVRGAGGNPASVQVAAVVHPPGPAGHGPFPVVVYLHGSGGLHTDEVAWVQHHLAAAGLLGVAGCWLPVANEADAGGISCPDAAADRRAAAEALIAVARGQPDGDPAALGLVGISAGGFETFDLLAQHQDVRVAVVDSAGTRGDVAAISAPVLMLGGTADPLVRIATQQRTEAALRAAGKRVEATFFEGAGHVVTMDPQVGDAATARAVTFLRDHLR